MSQALAIPQEGAIASTGYSLKEICQLGRIFADSGFFQDAKGEAQVITKILAGQEFGIAPFAAMTGIHIIGGKPSIGAGLMAQKVKESGKYDYRILQHDAKACEIEFFEIRRNGLKMERISLGVERFTIEEARTAELMKNAMWTKYPRNMLFARCMSNGVGFHCADVFSTRVFTPEELGAQVDENGEIIEDAPQAHVAPPVPQDTPEADVVEAVIFNNKKHSGLRPDQLSDAELNQYLSAWNGGSKCRPELRAEVERVLNERAENGELAPLPQTDAPAAPPATSNPTEGAAFGPVSVSTPTENGDAITEKQYSKLQDEAKRLWGPEKRDAKVAELLAELVGPDATLTGITSKQASKAIDKILELRAKVASNDTPLPREGVNLRRFHAVAKAAQLSSEEADREGRLKAINAWLAGHGGPVQNITSTKELTSGLMLPLCAAIEDASFDFAGAGWPVVAVAVAEGGEDAQS